MKESKNILLLAPAYMDIYKDVVEGLEQKGFSVTWVRDSQIPGNPHIYSIPRYRRQRLSKYNEQVKQLWINILNSEECKKQFDYFLAIDGLMADETLFQILNEKNPHIKKVLFVYDPIDGDYQIDYLFKYYDTVYSFDFGDCEKFKLNFLPIYWVPAESESLTKYDIFGLAALNYDKPQTIQFFQEVKNLAKRLGLSEYIQLFCGKQNKYKNLFWVVYNKIIGRKYYSNKELAENDLFTTNTLTPDEFRKTIQQSKTILDVQAPNQDGLTARFMWALGLGKKIMTFNWNVKRYPFYSKEQILILDNNYEEIPAFIESDGKPSEEIRKIIDKYRIDNWLDTLLDIPNTK